MSLIHKFFSLVRHIHYKGACILVMDHLLIRLLAVTCLALSQITMISFLVNFVYNIESLTISTKLQISIKLLWLTIFHTIIELHDFYFITLELIG